MSEGDHNLDSLALGLVGGAVVTALLDRLVQKGVLTVAEVHDILTAAHRDIGHRGQSVAGLHADHLISALVRHFSEGV